MKLLIFLLEKNVKACIRLKITLQYLNFLSQTQEMYLSRYTFRVMNFDVIGFDITNTLLAVQY